MTNAPQGPIDRPASQQHSERRTAAVLQSKVSEPHGAATAALVEPLAVGPDQAAALLELSRSMFYKMLESGRIGPKGVRLGKCVRFPLSELRAWAAAGMPTRDLWERMKEQDAG